MTELLTAELMRRQAVLEARVDLLARALAELTAPHQAAAPTLTGVVCGKCGADRLGEGCRLADRTRCLFTGWAQ